MAKELQALHLHWRELKTKHAAFLKTNKIEFNLGLGQAFEKAIASDAALEKTPLSSKDWWAKVGARQKAVSAASDIASKYKVKVENYHIGGSDALATLKAFHTALYDMKTKLGIDMKYVKDRYHL